MRVEERPSPQSTPIYGVQGARPIDTSSHRSWWIPWGSGFPRQGFLLQGKIRIGTAVLEPEAPE
ncbi:hypothetical protein ASPCADRAFT_211049, partial [Aspergillus carbonarius ITEM 5010]